MGSCPGQTGRGELGINRCGVCGIWVCISALKAELSGGGTDVRADPCVGADCKGDALLRLGLSA